MKKLLLIILTLMMLMFTSCSKKQEETTDTDSLVTIIVNTDWTARVALAIDDQPLEFDEDIPVQFIVEHVANGSVVTVTTEEKNDEHMFVKWKVNGQDYSNDLTISVVADQDLEFLAVFAYDNEYDGPTAGSVEEIETIGDILGLPGYGSTYGLDRLFHAFELNGQIYRVVANLDEQTADKLWQLDILDPNYKADYNELVGPIKVDLIDNISEKIPSQSELDTLIGKTGGQLLDDGWYIWYTNYEDKQFGMSHGLFSYNIIFNEDVEYKEDVNDEDIIRPLTVASITYESIDDIADFETSIP